MVRAGGGGEKLGGGRIVESLIRSEEGGNGRGLGCSPFKDGEPIRWAGGGDR